MSIVGCRDASVIGDKTYNDWLSLSLRATRAGDEVDKLGKMIAPRKEAGAEIAVPVTEEFAADRTGGATATAAEGEDDQRRQRKGERKREAASTNNG